MLTLLTMNWWALAIRGVFAVLFGVLAFVWPGLTLTVLVLLFGAYAIADGLFAIVAALSSSDRAARWWTLLLQGVLGVIAGLVTFLWPGITTLFLLYLIAFWAIFTGGFQIAAAIRLRKELTGEWLLALGGAASIAFGVLLLLFPGAGALAVVWWIGAYAIVFGVLLLTLALRLRRRHRDLTFREPRTA